MLYARNVDTDCSGRGVASQKAGLPDYIAVALQEIL